MIFKDVTAPGYFDFSADQSAATKRFSDAWNSYFNYISEQETLFTDIFKNWKNRDYSNVTVARTEFVLFQLRSCGLAWFRGVEEQAAKLAAFVQAGFDQNISLGIFDVLNFLSATPFNWCLIGSLQITKGIQVPAMLSEVLAIYSTSVGAPATPAPSAYVERDWLAPATWVKHSEASTYISFGVLSGSTITWSTPYAVGDVTYYFRANLASMPAVSAGNVTVVDDDGTDDTTSSYFYNGSSWQKFSTTFDKQGLVLEGVPSDPPQSVVAAPDPNNIEGALSSDTTPPISGPSKGYGMYAGLSESTISANAINIFITLTADGVENLGVIIHLLRRVKPTLNTLLLIYDFGGSVTIIDIADTGELI